MAPRWRRRRSPADEAQQAKALAEAQEALAEARAQHRTQARKREQEAEGVIARMERLAEDNHLAALVWDVVSGNGGTR